MSYLKIIFIITIAISCNAQNKKKNEISSRIIVSGDSIPKSIYNTFRKQVKDSIDVRILANRSPYYPKEYDKRTVTYMDTIFFNPAIDRFFVIVISKNSNDKQIIKGDSNSYHFSGHCFIGKISKNQITEIWWLKQFSIVNFDDSESVSKRIKEFYFDELATIKDSVGLSQYKYNLGDLRFWEGPLWTE